MFKYNPASSEGYNNLRKLKFSINMHELELQFF
jgi:hypothetical protein